MSRSFWFGRSTGVLALGLSFLLLTPGAILDSAVGGDRLWRYVGALFGLMAGVVFPPRGVGPVPEPSYWQEARSTACSRQAVSARRVVALFGFLAIVTVVLAAMGADELLLAAEVCGQLAAIGWALVVWRRRRTQADVDSAHA